MPRRSGDEIDWPAEEALAKKRARLLRGRMKPEEVSIEVWLSSHHLLFPDGRSVRTRRSELSLMRGLRRAHGREKMAAFTPMQAQAWALEHPGSVRLLRKAWRRAVLAGIAPLNVWLLVEMPRRQKERRRPPTAVELEGILARCGELAIEEGEPWWVRVFVPMVEVAAYSGARQGGLIRLSRADVDVVARRFEVTEKGEKTRRLVLTAPALVAMERVLGAVWPWCECRVCVVDGGWCAACGLLPWRLAQPVWGRRRRRELFPEGRLPLEVRARVFRWKDGTVLTPDRVQKAWSDARGDFGHGFHSLKHFAATWLAERGVDRMDIAVQLGHTDGEGRPYDRLVRRVYDHPDPELALRRLEEAVA